MSIEFRQRHKIERVRRETPRRSVTISAIADITPRMRRLTFAGDELAGFESSAYDDHIKLFFSVGESDVVARNMTPRRFDPIARTLDVDVALHDGPIANWARNAGVGSPAWVGGPRGSYVVPTDFDWYLFLGDETALPAIGRRLEELPAGRDAVVIVEVADASDEQHLPSRAAVDITWLHRGTAAAGTTDHLATALTRFTLPAGDGYIWAACESDVAKTLRAGLIARGARREWLRVSAYWNRGKADVHETLND